MPSVSHITRIRRRRNQKQSRAVTGRLSLSGLGCSASFSLLAVGLLVGLTAGYAWLMAGLPAPASLTALLEPQNGSLLQPTRILDRTGKQPILVLENPAVTERIYLSLGPTADSEQLAEAVAAGSKPRDNQIPAALVAATLAASEPAFWEHSGFTWSGISQGKHTTLAQKLVSELLLWDEPPGIRRALRERLLAAQLTRLYGRNKVLEWFINNANYGQLAYGADAAARVYFGKSAADLSLGEATILAATVEAPALNFIDAPKAALERQKKTLQVMYKQGWLSSSQLAIGLLEPAPIATRVEKPQNLAPAFTNLVLEQLSAHFPLERLARGGLQILTSLDADLQAQTTCAAQVQLDWSAAAATADQISAANTGCEAARLLPTLPGTAKIKHPTANAIVLDPASGQILAMVGDASAGLDPAHLPGHPPGTLFSPFIFLTAFTRGLSPASLIWDIPARLPDFAADLNTPVTIFHGPLRARSALVNDYLAPAAQLIDQVGAENIWRTARQLNLASMQTRSAAETFDLLQGNGEATLLELSQAYGAFANQGVLAGQQYGTPESAAALQPVTVLQVIDGNGHIWLDCGSASSPFIAGNQGQLVACTPVTRPVISQPLAYLLNQVLSDEPVRWPSLGHPNPLEIGRPVGAKIGQTASGHDAWTIGYTPDLVVGVWLGSADPDSTDQVSTLGAAGLWHAIIQYASRNEEPQGWEQPAGVNTLIVCDPSGLLPTADCPATVEEVFLDGSEPTHPDTLFRSYQVNRESGQLATVFTPPELIEPRVFMLIPSDALEWAKSAGLPIPPDSYDAIDISFDTDPDAQITSPANFSSVSGRVAITGRAAGKGFKFYRLQAGPGLNPQDWEQIGADIDHRVANGLLGNWDTTGLDGLYALQLLSVKDNQTVAVSTVQVTIDNLPPQVDILSPQADQVLPLSRAAPITFQAEAEDNLGLARVEFTVDKDLILTLSAPPYTASWVARPGVHELRVRAIDRAGNSREAAITFQVKP